MGSSSTFKYEPETNGDALLAFEHLCPPGLGVPAHTERNHEAFYVLEGTLEVEVDGDATGSARATSSACRPASSTRCTTPARARRGC